MNAISGERLREHFVTVKASDMGWWATGGAIGNLSHQITWPGFREVANWATWATWAICLLSLVGWSCMEQMMSKTVWMMKMMMMLCSLLLIAWQAGGAALWRAGSSNGALATNGNPLFLLLVVYHLPPTGKPLLLLLETKDFKYLTSCYQKTKPTKGSAFDFWIPILNLLRIQIERLKIN